MGIWNVIECWFLQCLVLGIRSSVRTLALPLRPLYSTRAQSDFTPFTTTHCFLKQRKESIHFNVLQSIPQLNNLLLRSSWGGVSNAFSKSNMNCVNLSSIVQDFNPIIYYPVVSWVSQLCPFLNACCLSDRSLYSSRWAMISEHTMCLSYLQGTQVKENGR